MKPRVFALDFDGTIAVNDTMDVLLADLAIDEAVLLPGPFESGDSFKRFHVAPRLTAHVRHRHKYADVPVHLDQEFLFTQEGRPTGTRARTVRDLLSALPALPDDVVLGHLARGDFRRWIDDVFGDRELGGAIQHLERGGVSSARDVLLRAIADRYGGSSTREAPDRGDAARLLPISHLGQKD